MRDFNEFPSPYGVTVIKSHVYRLLPVCTGQTFPSPYGVTVIKSGHAAGCTPSNMEVFPSPYGVTVIKSLSSVITITMQFI